MGRESRVAGRVLAALCAVVPVTGHWSPVAAQQRVAPAPGGELSTSITIYQDSRILVRRNWPLRIAAGSATVPLPLAPVDPASVVSLDSAVAIVGATTAPG